MIKGTRILFNDEANQYIDLIDKLRITAKSLNYQEIILPSLWETELFIEKAGEDIIKQLYNFQDKAGREIGDVVEDDNGRKYTLKERLSP